MKIPVNVLTIALQIVNIVLILLFVLHASQGLYLQKGILILDFY